MTGKEAMHQALNFITDTLSKVSLSDAAEDELDGLKYALEDAIALYAAPAGWRLVPCEPTQGPVHCPDCPDQGWYGIETGGVDMDGENDTRQMEQVQCQFCYLTPNSVFNIANTAPQPPQAERVPMTEAEVDALAQQFGFTTNHAPPWFVEIARAVEARHGIR